MKKYIIKGLFAVLTLTASVGCEDFLTQDNPSSQTFEENYKTIQDCEAGVAAIYNAYKTPAIYAFVDENLRSDLAVTGVKNRSAYTSQALLQTFNDVYATANTKWQAIYTGVLYSNQAIKGLDNVYPSLKTDADLQKWNELKAQAYLFRGIFYFFLHTSYNQGSVPIFDYVPSGTEDLFRPVSSSDEVKEFYRNDIQAAIEMGIPASWSSDRDNGRLTLGAANSIMGMSYLYDNDYETAASYFEKVIAEPYELVGIDENHTTKSEFNKESILEVSYSLDYNTELSGSSALYNTYGMYVSRAGGWTSLSPALWLVETYRNEPIDSLNTENWCTFNADTIRYTTDGVNELVSIDAHYQQLGKDLVVVNNNNLGGITEEAYVFQQNPDTHIFDTIIQKRVITYDAESNIESVKYTDMEVTRDRFKTFTGEDGQLHYYKFFSKRASTYLALNEDDDVPYYGAQAQSKVSFKTGDCAYFRKYSNWDIRSMETQITPAQASAINLRLIRLADIYLMYAECLIKGGTDDSGVAEAIKYINRIRKRAGTVLIGGEDVAGAEYVGVASYGFEYEKEYEGNNYAVTDFTKAEDVMYHLKYVERPLELCLDGFGQRVIDMRRWGIAKARFDELSKIEYSLNYTPFIKNLNGVISKYYNLGDLTRPMEGSSVYTDYSQASENYTDEQAYWPLPSVEKTANPYIN